MSRFVANEVEEFLQQELVRYIPQLVGKTDEEIMHFVDYQKGIYLQGNLPEFGRPIASLNPTFTDSTEAISFSTSGGWAHNEAGKKYGKKEMSFRQTIHGKSRSDRGFKVIIDRKERKILISFDARSVDPRHRGWLDMVKKRVGLGELNPQPYWGFDDLEHKAGTKLLNAFYVQSEVKKDRKKEYYKYTRVMMLQKFNFEGFLKAIEEGNILVDFDARSGHNHGTKFRLRQDCLPMLYEKTTVII